MQGWSIKQGWCGSCKGGGLCDVGWVRGSGGACKGSDELCKLVRHARVVRCVRVMGRVRVVGYIEVVGRARVVRCARVVGHARGLGHVRVVRLARAMGYAGAVDCEGCWGMQVWLGVRWSWVVQGWWVMPTCVAQQGLPRWGQVGLAGAQCLH